MDARLLCLAFFLLCYRKCDFVWGLHSNEDRISIGNSLRKELVDARMLYQPQRTVKEHSHTGQQQTSRKKRSLMQARGNGDFDCSLSSQEKNRFLDADTRVWTIDESVLSDVNNDLQSIINCTKEDDVVFFDVDETILPSRGVTIPWNLTLSTISESTEFEDGLFPETESKTVFTCPDTDEGVFLVRSESVLFANLAFEGCTFEDSKSNAIIEIAECESSQNSGSIRLHHVTFEDNELISGLGLQFNSPSCSSLEMVSVEFVQNKCNGVCGAVLSFENDLLHLRIEENTVDGEVDDNSAILFAPEGSKTKADTVIATNNEITVLMIRRGSLEMSDCSFGDNDVSRSDTPQSACIYLIDSNSTIEDTDFKENKADNGAAIYVDNSTLTLNDCKFEENKASFGGALFVKDKSVIRIVACNFSRNAAGENGGAMHAVDSKIVIESSEFGNQLASENAGCFSILATEVNCTDSIFFGNHASHGGISLARRRADLYFSECTFDDNSAEMSGGMAYLDEQSKLVMDNCVVTNGNASAGAIIFAVDAEMIEVRKTSIEENTAVDGGSIALFKTAAVLFDVSAMSNKASGFGGFIWASQESRLEILSSQFSSNEGNYGGVLLSSSSIVNIRDSFFGDNVAEEGGVFRLFNASRLVITNATFFRNEAQYGGAIVVQDGAMDISNCTFFSNEATNSGGSIYGDGSELTITDSQFLNGKAEYGGVFMMISSTLTLTNANLTQSDAVSGAALRIRDNSNVASVNVSMTRNRAEDSGGAIDCFDSIFFASNCTMSFNTADNGAAVYSTNSTFDLENSTVSKNAAENAALSFEENTNATIRLTIFTENQGNFGGAISVEESDATFDQCTFVSNSAEKSGGAFYVEDAKADIKNCILNSSKAEVGAGIFSSGSRVTFRDSSCLWGIASNGGCVYGQSTSTFIITNVTMENNRANENGGAVALIRYTFMNMSNSIVRRNHAVDNGGSFYVEESDLHISNSTIKHSEAVNNGGAIYCKQESGLLVSDMIFADSNARRGGTVYLFESQGNFTSATFRKSSATISGGAVFAQKSAVNITEVDFIENETVFGGAVCCINASVNINTAKFNDCKAEDQGGFIYAADKSGIQIRDASMDNGSSTFGGAINIDNSDLFAFQLVISRCSATNEGGAIRGNGTSTFLCSGCIFAENVAKRKGGGVSMESSETQSLAYQFDKSTFRSNSAILGGGLHIITSEARVNCLKPKANCTFTVLSDTSFVGNKAVLGASLFVSNLKAVRVNCSSGSTELQLEFFKRRQWESMNIINSTESICENWKGNKARRYGDNVATYASRVKAEIVTADNSKEPVQTSENFTIIENYASGQPLPEIRLQTVDDLGQGPAIGVAKTIVRATLLSPEKLFYGAVTILLTKGRGIFTGISGFGPNKTYELVITFSETALKPLKIMVKVRACYVGESLSPDGSICVPCNTATYNFRSAEKDSEGCLPCPENGDCRSSVIIPEKGYWHSFPCSEYIQRCLTDRACNFDNRQENLTEFVKDIKTCDLDKEEIANYSVLLCRPGHTGPLCGSCQEHYGRAQSFDCKECFTDFGNVVLVILSILVLMGLAGFTTRTNLVSSGRKGAREQTPKSRRELEAGPSGTPSRRSIQMMEMYVTGHVPREKLEENKSELSPSSKKLQTHQDAELAKWKSVEMFKIMINFTQITAVAVSVNVDWSVWLIALFETAEFLGGVTSEASSRSVDCLVSEDSSIPRSVLSTIVDVTVPALVVAFFTSFWLIVKIAYREKWAYLFKRCMLSTLAVFYISYISNTKTLVNILNCIEVHDSDTPFDEHETHYWAVDTRLKCYEESHDVLAGMIGYPLLIIFSLGFPVFVAFIILKNVDTENYKQGWIYDTTGFMYRSYRPRFVFWESIIMLRKAVLAVVVVFAYPLGANLQAVLCVFVLALASYSQTVCRPYRDEFKVLNEMEGLSLLVSLLTFVSSFCFENDRVPSAAKIFITVAIFLCNLALFCFFFVFFCLFGSQYLRLVLERDGVPHDPEGGALYILFVYAKHMISNVRKGFGIIVNIIIRRRGNQSNNNRTNA